MAVSDQTASALLEVLGSLGLEARRLGVRGLTSDEDLARLWDKGVSITGRTSLPLEVGLLMPMGAMGVIDYLAASSSNLGAALTMAQHLFPLVGPGVQLHIERSRSGRRRLTIVNQPPFSGQVASDSLIVGILIGRSRHFARDPVTFPNVFLTHPVPRDEARWRLLLDVEKLHFGARQAGIEFTTAAWQAPLRSADPRLTAALSHSIGFNRAEGDPLLVTLRTLATQTLPAALTLGSAAAAVGCSRRTLQRRLTALKTSVSQLVDEARRHRAEQLLLEAGFTSSEVARRIGFAEAASFTRAWQRWFGVAPSRDVRGSRRS